MSIKVFIQIFFIFYIFMLNVNGDTTIETESGENKSIASSIILNQKDLDYTLMKMNQAPLRNNKIEAIFNEYQNSLNNNQTVKFKIGTVFQSQMTCEGIKANLNDIIPVIEDIIITTLEQIPTYIINNITGYNFGTPEGFAEAIVDMSSYVLCASYTVVVLVPEQALKASVEYYDKLMSTATNESEVKTNIEIAAPTAAVEKSKQAPALNKSAGVQAKAELTSSFTEEFNEKLGKCMDYMKNLYRDVITSKIKNFTPFKVKKRKSGCEMLKTKEKKSPAKDLTIYSPIKAHALDYKKQNGNQIKANEYIIKNDLIITQFSTGKEDKIKKMIKLNVDSINNFIADGQKILDVSNKLPSINVSREVKETGIEIVSILNTCLNDPTLNICEKINCQSTASMDSECQRPNPNIPSQREIDIPINFQLPNTQSFDYSKIDSLLLKLKLKKVICLKAGIMNKEEKRRFIFAFNNILNPNSLLNINKRDSETIFNIFILEQFCNVQFEEQLKDFEKFETNKRETLKRKILRATKNSEITFSKFKERKAEFSKDISGFENYEEMCSWTDNQNFTSVLYKNPLTNAMEIKKVMLSNLDTSEISHTEPMFDTYGVCMDAVCSGMKCVYDCVNEKCPDITNTPFSTAELNNNTITQIYNAYKNDPQNKKYGSDEKRKIKTVGEYIEEMEKSTFEEYRKIYTNYNNFAKKFSLEVMTIQLERQSIEESLFLY